MARFICIHGHFYQPPRENAWLESVEVQDSAYPAHDWNERVTDECYAPNTASRIMDGEGHIVEIVNNYSRISFNMGPTLLAWMQDARPEIHEAIVDAEPASRARYGSHGSALAQVYNHMIMPLANDRDKRTQVLWGLADFRHRFGAEPQGMWLPETAVDLPTLEVLAEHGIAFTILAPRQAARVRPPGGGDWVSVEGAKIDPKQPYRCTLPSGRSIVLFFYDGAISQEIGFGKLLESGENLINRLMGTFTEGDQDQLVHIATDGETYGHHRRFGDMALAYALHRLEIDGAARLTNYGEYLEHHPPTHEVEIYENSSWSCAHGIERWRSNCGCNSGVAWSQAWRAPLREALDWLREQLAPIYEKAMAPLVGDPWRARDEYIDVVLDRGEENVRGFLERQGAAKADDLVASRILSLLEMQRHAMLMYTSCGWFFDEISGTETHQVLQYACRALQLAEQISGRRLEPEFIKRLSAAPSNLPQFKDGAGVYEQLVLPKRVDMLRVAGHYAVSSLFYDYPEEAEIYCYTILGDNVERPHAGRFQLSTGLAHIRSRITWEAFDATFAVLYLGGHMLHGGVKQFTNEEERSAMHNVVVEAFNKGDVADVIRVIDEHFGSHSYSMWSLFRDVQREVFEPIVAGVLSDVEGRYRRIYDDDYPLVKAMHDLNMPRPPSLIAPIEFVLNRELQRLFEADIVDTARMAGIVHEIRQVDVPLDDVQLAIRAGRFVAGAMARLAESPHDDKLLRNVRDVLKAARELGLGMRLWEAQNTYYQLGTRGDGGNGDGAHGRVGEVAVTPGTQEALPRRLAELRNGDGGWPEMFTEVGRLLELKVD